MWDYESDAPFMWPEKQKYPTADEDARRSSTATPKKRRPAASGATRISCRTSSTLNPQLKDTQFADYHGHGWNFRAVFKRDRKGNLLDEDGNASSPTTIREKFKKAVHLSTIHLDVGMQCVDCHFAQDSHGNGHIYGEVAAAIEIDCADCHGTVDKLSDAAHLRPGGAGRRHRPGAAAHARRPQALRVESTASCIQRSALDPELEWEVSLVKDTVDPRHPSYNAKAARAQADGRRHRD